MASNRLKPGVLAQKRFGESLFENWINSTQ